ncbi:cathepsin L [Trichonephila inaurata madagascariensis]|uniref:Cathepsin L n=1 Tax=Trichonephila inaurata madagascariensis TaxID=2747483 RepID=A0A8X6X7B4_9ARAC|nr:cathepsin L [Trichonephila inaurata madagascariensis]
MQGTEYIFKVGGKNKDSIMLLVIFSLLAITEARISNFGPSLPNPHPSIQEIIARDPIWIGYKMTHRKYYIGEEDVMRRRIFFENMLSTLKHNLEELKGLKSFRRGINKYSDLTHEEYMKYLNGYKFKPHATVNSTDWMLLVAVDLPDKVDWREKGLVTPIKDQGMCGSCWAFSSTGSLEGQHKKKTGNLVSLSEQNLVDCVKENDGCNGGWMDSAFEQIKKENGIDTETSYPYVGIQDSCFFNEFTVGANCTGYVDIPEGDEEVLKQAVAKVGPISVAINADSPNFHNYGSGIYDEPNCANTVSALTHAVLVIGYGTENGTDYWLVKNR